MQRLTIEGINGDGSQAPIVSTDPALGRLDGRQDASKRIREGLWIEGTNLDQVTSVRLVGTDGAGRTYEQDDTFKLQQGGTHMRRKLLLPFALVAGAYILTLTGPHGDAAAQVYVLQGEKGDPGEPGQRGPAGPEPSEERLKALIEALVAPLLDPFSLWKAEAGIEDWPNAVVCEYGGSWIILYVEQSYDLSGVEVVDYGNPAQTIGSVNPAAMYRMETGRIAKVLTGNGVVDNGSAAANGLTCPDRLGLDGRLVQF